MSMHLEWKKTTTDKLGTSHAIFMEILDFVCGEHWFCKSIMIVAE